MCSLKCFLLAGHRALPVLVTQRTSVTDCRVTPRATRPFSEESDFCTWHLKGSHVVCNDGERRWDRTGVKRVCAVWTSRPSFNVRCRRGFFRLWFLILVHEAWSDDVVSCLHVSLHDVFQFAQCVSTGYINLLACVDVECFTVWCLKYHEIKAAVSSLLTLVCFNWLIGSLTFILCFIFCLWHLVY